MWRLPQAVAGKPMRRKGTRTGLNIDKLKVWVVGHILKRPRFQQLLNRSRSLWCQRFGAFCEGAKGSHLLLGWSGWSRVPWLVVRQYFGRCPSLLAKNGIRKFLHHIEICWKLRFWVFHSCSHVRVLLFASFCNFLWCFVSLQTWFVWNSNLVGSALGW